MLILERRSIAEDSVFIHDRCIHEYALIENTDGFIVAKVNEIFASDLNLCIAGVRPTSRFNLSYSSLCIVKILDRT